MWLTRFRTLALGAVVLLGALSGSGFSQDAPPEQAVPTAARPDIDPAELKLLLKPLTKEQLVAEAERWQGLLGATQARISALQIEAPGAQPAQLAELMAERARIYDRNKVVLAELRLKGGDPAEFAAYADAVTDIASVIDVTDATGAWNTLKTWGASDEGGVRWAKNIGKFLLVLLLSWIVAKVVSKILRRVLDTHVMDFNEMLERFFVNTTRNLILAIGIMVGLSMLEVEVGPLLAAMGVVGFILGFALQETLGNFAAGLMLLIYQPYDLGHFIKAAGESGKVAGMNLVSTVLLTPDNQRIVVPNGKIWGGTITNVTGSDTRRVDLTFGIAYDDDIEEAKRVLTEIVTAHEKVLDDPEPVIRVHALADSSVNFIVRPWTKTPDYWDVYWDITQAVKQRFDAEGISIPFPQREIHVVRQDADKLSG